MRLGRRQWSSAALVGILASVSFGCATPATHSAVTPVPSRTGPAEADPTQRTSPLRGPAHPDRATIIDGSWLIGADFPPALYLTPTAVTRCHWRIVDYASGALIEEGDYSGPGPTAIWVGDGDLFKSEGCFLWQGYPQLTGERSPAEGIADSEDGTDVILTDGRWLIGTDATPGRYRSDRASTGACSFGVDRDDNRDDESFRSTATRRSIPAYLDLTLNSGDLFTTQDCGQWHLLRD